AELAETAREIVGATVVAHILDTAARVQHDRDVVRAQQPERGQAARRGVREAERVAVEHAVEVEEEEPLGPPRPRAADEPGMEPVHPRDQEAAGAQAPPVPLLAALGSRL